MTSLFKTPKVEKPPAPVAMPVAEDVAARQARRKAMEAGTGGRMGTILGDAGNFGAYASKTLGAGNPR